MFQLVGWIILGSLLGTVSKVLTPGRDPGGFSVSILLGMAGACLGGWVGSSYALSDPGEPPGFTLALIGAVVIQVLYRVFFARTTA